jgi:signal transduction histidine kinase
MLDVGLLEQGEIPLQRNPVILGDMVEAVHEQVEPRASAKETELIFQPLPDAPVLFIDGGMIRRVLINLVDNAIKYTPNQGTVTLTTELIDEVLHFTVSDNGPGISPADQIHIFDKFSRVDHTSKISGVGLGLAFCKLATEAHGGTISVESDGIPGQGSTFRLTVPIGTDELDF